MNLSPMVAEWVAAYEQEHGRKPAELAIQAVEHIVKIGEQLTELGRKDAQEGKEAYWSGEFPKLVRIVFHNIPSEATTKEIAELWQSDYMDGYTVTIETQ